MTADSDFLDDVNKAEKRHASRCKCKTKAWLVGQDGPDMRTLTAGWRLAEALAAEFDAKPGDVAAAGQRTAAMLDAYRRARMGE